MSRIESLETSGVEGITGYTSRVKTAISLPDDVFEAVDACAKRLRLTRSGLLAAAAREFVARHASGDEATRAWDETIARVGQPGDDATAAAFRRRSKAVMRGRR
jgi:predicted transcriptional regulator